MTKAQSSLYWRTWQRVCRANGWRMCQGRLANPPERAVIHSQRHDQVKHIAEDIASGRLRRVTLDDLRHACHVVASGADISHSEMKQSAFDKLLLLWRLLVNPEDLAASIEWDNPDIGERRRLVWRIHQAAPDAYIDNICRDRFGPRYTPTHWQDLPTPCLRDLVRTLSSRTKRWARPIPRNEPEHESADCPF